MNSAGKYLPKKTHIVLKRPLKAYGQDEWVKEMPLRVTSGIPITLRNTAPGVTNLDVGETTLAGTVVAKPTTCDPPIDPVIQQQTEWCWAACVEMGLTHYHLHQPQCTIVDTKRTIVKDVNDPAATAASSCCDNALVFDKETCNVEFIDDVWDKFHIEATQRGTPSSASQKVTFKTIQAEIAANRPVEVALSWNSTAGGGGHAVLIVGWTTINGADALLVNDPLPTSKRRLVLGQLGLILMSELEIASGFGSWERTWTDIKPKTNGPQGGFNNG